MVGCGTSPFVEPERRMALEAAQGPSWKSYADDRNLGWTITHDPPELDRDFNPRRLENGGAWNPCHRQAGFPWSKPHSPAQEPHSSGANAYQTETPGQLFGKGRNHSRKPRLLQL